MATGAEAARESLRRELAEYGEDVVLRDGGSLRLRALGPSDRAATRSFFEHLGPRSTYFRFFAARATVLEEEVARLTQLDARRTVALAAVEDKDGEEHIVGVSEFTVTGVFPGADGESLERAEFAVAVSDQHQGRGIGTLLLERIVATARRCDVDELEAFVLRGNREMLDVFENSGLSITETEDGDHWKVVLKTAETDAFHAASLARERIAERESVRVFFEPRSVAVVGASRHPGTIGHTLVDNLLGNGFKGPVYPVNPEATEILGLEAYPSLVAIREPVDLVLVAVAAKHVEHVVAEAAGIGARGVVIISSGFAETSPEGRAQEFRLRRLVRDAGMRLIGPNCMGVLNASPLVALDATFAPEWPPFGNVSMLSQSGALGIALLDHARASNIGIAKFASVGNRADVSSNDLLSYWGDDPETGVIVLYLEGIGNARKFARVAPDVARRKPIVAVKSGRSSAGKRAARSHSASLASIDVGVDALFEHSGVIRTNTLAELFDVASFLSTQPVPAGPRVGVVTNAGGPGILLADACEAHGLSLPPLSTETVATLKALLPAQGGFGNPVDTIASATPEQLQRSIEAVGRDPNVDSVVVIYIPPLPTDHAAFARAIARGAAQVPSQKPIAAVFMSSKGAPTELCQGPRGKIPSYVFPENAAIALSAAVRYSRFRSRLPGTPRVLGRPEQRRIRALVERALANGDDGKAWLDAAAVEAVLGLAGIRVARSRTVETPEQAAAAGSELGFPVVLKARASGLVHRTDAGGVRLGLSSPEAVRVAANTMAERVRASGYEVQGYLLQEEIRDGFECIVGVTTDPSLGPIVVAGLGGVQVEIVGDVAFRLPPVTDADADAMVDSLKAKVIFEGFRGAPPADRAAFADVICRVSALVDAVPELTELDLNPLKVLPRGRGAIAVDARIRVMRRPPHEPGTVEGEAGVRDAFVNASEVSHGKDASSGVRREGQDPAS